MEEGEDALSKCSDSERGEKGKNMEEQPDKVRSHCRYVHTVKTKNRTGPLDKGTTI